MKKSLIILVAVILCTCMIAGCFLENKKPAEEPAGPVVLDSTPGLEDDEADMTIEEETESGEPVAISYVTPGEGVSAPEGYEQVTPEKDAVLGSLDYPVYSFTDSNGYTRYTAMGQPVDDKGNPSGDPSWCVFVMRTVGTQDSKAKQYVFRDAYDQTGLLPAGAVPAEGDEIPAQMGFTVYSVEMQDAAGNYTREYYAYADVYDTSSPGMAEPGWQKVALVTEKVPEDAYSRLLKGQKVYIYYENGNVKGSFEYGSGMVLNPDFSQDTVGVRSWDIVPGDDAEALQSTDAIAELIISGETTEDLKKEEEEKTEEEKKKEEEKKEEEKKEEETQEEDSDENTGKHEHDWNMTEWVEPTCTEKGSAVYECAICGEKKTEEVSLAEHDWELDHYDKTGCTDPVVNHYKCAVCGATMTEKGDPIGHSPAGWTVSPDSPMTQHVGICTECGKIVDKGKHEGSPCTVCGYLGPLVE